MATVAEFHRCSDSVRLFFYSWSWCDLDYPRDVGDVEHVEACADVVVVAVVGADAVVAVAEVDVVVVQVATFVVVADGSACDNVAYSAGEIFYRYRRRNFSKSH